MKRLVICCDGTWKRADDQNVSNIEKIARAIDVTPPDDAGVNAIPPARKAFQIVYYSAGVGTGATWMEHLIGGATGLGLNAALIGAYRFLALNYEQGDEVYVFGFSRGAYTARSLVGMIAAIGLLTPDGVVQDNLHRAIDVYRNRPREDDPHPDPKAVEAVAAFREDCAHDDQVNIRFLGVFDTVGALGVPGFSRRKYQFHNVALTRQVATARQALAIHERRRAFAPAMWLRNADDHADVKQVWFEGVHTDVGGGCPADETALSDLALTWMIAEAKKCGLVFHEGRIDRRLRSEPLKLHDSLTLGYRLLNFIGEAVQRLRGGRSRFSGGYRILEDVDPHAEKEWNVRISASARERRHTDPGTEVAWAPNVDKWIEVLREKEIDPTDREEALPPWPDVTALHMQQRRAYLA